MMERQGEKVVGDTHHLVDLGGKQHHDNLGGVASLHYLGGFDPKGYLDPKATQEAYVATPLPQMLGWSLGA